MTNGQFSPLTPRGVERRVRQHVLGRTQDFFAVVQPGFESTALYELSRLGIHDIRSITTGGIEFSARIDTLYETCIRSRTLTRVLMRLGSFSARRFDTLRSHLASFPWELYLHSGCHAVFRVASRASRLYHTGRIEDEAKKSVARRLGLFGIPVSAGMDVTADPVQTIYIRMNEDNCQLSIDASAILYRRGDKTQIVRAPLRETLAALILYEARSWEYDLVLDPMCGSGTFSLEAASIRAGRVPSMERHFPFMGWPCFKPKAYAYLKRTIALDTLTAQSVLSALEHPIVLASDRDEDAVRTTFHNITAAGLDRFVMVSRKDFFREAMDITSNERCLVVLNPPFGKRIEYGDEDMYERIGVTFRRHHECGFAIIVPGIEKEKQLGLPFDRKIPFIYGGLRVAVLFRDGTGA